MVERAGLSWQIESDGSHVHFFGDLTEECDLGPLAAQLPASVRLELSQVRRINSCGVREWINFVSALERAGKQVTLEQCSVALVAQLNAISNFRGGAEVKSVLAPFHCTACERDHAQLLPLDAAAPRRLREQPPCPHCGGALEFDDFPESYLAFTAR